MDGCRGGFYAGSEVTFLDSLRIETQKPALCDQQAQERSGSSSRSDGVGASDASCPSPSDGQCVSAQMPRDERLFDPTLPSPAPHKKEPARRVADTREAAATPGASANAHDAAKRAAEADALQQQGATVSTQAALDVENAQVAVDANDDQTSHARFWSDSDSGYSAESTRVDKKETRKHKHSAAEAAQEYTESSDDDGSAGKREAATHQSSEPTTKDHRAQAETGTARMADGESNARVQDRERTPQAKRRDGADEQQGAETVAVTDSSSRNQAMAKRRQHMAECRGFRDRYYSHGTVPCVV
jgi:hypothetical protein